MAMVYQAGELSVPLERPTAEHQDLLLLIGTSYDRLVGGTGGNRGHVPAPVAQTRFGKPSRVLDLPAPDTA